jgi:hypothetical protein
MMARLRRFPEYRFIGRRDSMVVYDCDDEGQFGDLEASVRDLGLDQSNLLQAFAPDDLTEAANRGFHAAKLALGTTDAVG